MYEIHKLFKATEGHHKKILFNVFDSPHKAISALAPLKYSIFNNHIPQLNYSFELKQFEHEKQRLIYDTYTTWK